jgi:chromosome segregation ATPase
MAARHQSALESNLSSMGFSDLMSSGRGPGVIGTLLALLVLVGFGTLYIFVFDEGMQGGKKTIESVIREQALAIDSDKEEIGRIRRQLSEGEQFKEQERELASLKAQSDRNLAQIEELNSGKATAEAAIVEAHKKWEDYKDAYRASEWARAKGEKLGTVVCLSGATYQDVVIREVNQKEMRISDSTGPKSIDSADLPLALQDRFQFDKEKKDVAERDEKDTEEVHRKKVQYSQTKEKRDTKNSQIAALKGEVENKAAAIKKANEDIPRWTNKIQQQQSAIAAEKLKTLSKAPLMEDELRRMERSAEENRSSISRLQNEKREAEGKIRTLEQEVADHNAELPKIAKELQDLLAAAAAGKQ